MATTKLEQQTKASLTVTGLSTLASATYVVSNAVTPSTNDPVDVLIEVSAASTNTVAVGKKLDVFAVVSLDGTNYSSGPTSGTTTTDEPDLYLIGRVPMNTSTTTHTKTFSFMRAIGFIPQSFKLVLKNDIGVALTSGSVNIAEVFCTTA